MPTDVDDAGSHTEPKKYLEELERLQSELEKRDHRLSHLGAVLRTKHLELLKTQCEDAPIARRVRIVELRLRSFLDVSLNQKLNIWKEFCRLVYRLQRSFQKRKEKLGSLWKKQDTGTSQPLHEIEKNHPV